MWSGWGSIKKPKRNKHKYSLQTIKGTQNGTTITSSLRCCISFLNVTFLIFKGHFKWEPVSCTVGKKRGSFQFSVRKVQNYSLNLFSPSQRVEIYGLAVMVKFAVKLVRMALYISGSKSILDLWLTNAKRKSHIWAFVESYNVETKTGMFQKMENIIHGMPSLIRTPFHQS